MSLEDELDALRAEFVRSAPPGRATLCAHADTLQQVNSDPASDPRPDRLV